MKNIDKDLLKELDKAYRTEKLAVKAYLAALKNLEELGILHPQLADKFLEIILDSIVHRNIVAAIIDSLREIENIKREIEDIETTNNPKIGEEQAAYLEKILKEHDEIEKGVIECYQDIARKAPTKLIARIALAIADDEKKHYKYLQQLKTLPINSKEEK